MNRREFLRCIPISAFCLFTHSEAKNQYKWEKPRLLVTPGVGLGPIRLGEPLSQEVFEILGPYTEGHFDVWAYPGWYMDTGISVQKTPEGKVELIRVLPGVRAYTKEGLTMNMSFDKARKIYHEGSYQQRPATDSRGRPTGRQVRALQIPGLRISNSDPEGQVMESGENRVYQLVIEAIV